MGAEASLPDRAESGRSTTSDHPVADPDALRLTLDAWGHSGVGIRLAALLVVGVAIGSVVIANVPPASAIAVIVLVPAALVDIRCHRLPDAWVLLAATLFLGGLGVSAAWGRPFDLGAIAIGSLVMAVPLLAMHLWSPEAMGFGDVKAAVVLGAALGAVGWELAVSALALAAGFSATVGLMRRAPTIAFGPGLVIGAVTALAIHDLLLRAVSEGTVAT
jgi:leader peptidase (prepilin peptidase) / N-methyltransferase